MLERSMNTVLEDHEKKIGNRPLILGVSVLTSIDEDDFASLGLLGKLEDQVKRLADLAKSANLLTWSSSFPSNPSEAKSSSSMLVKTLTPNINGLLPIFFS